LILLAQDGTTEEAAEIRNEVPELQQKKQGLKPKSVVCGLAGGTEVQPLRVLATPAEFFRKL